MKIIFPFITLIIGFILGFYLGGEDESLKESKTDTTKIVSEKISPKISSSLNSEIEKMTHEELQEYIQLKDMKAKYEKADEILGKVILLFLANLGTKVPSNVQHYFAQGNPKRNYIEPEAITVAKKEQKGPELFLNEKKKKINIDIFKKINEEEFAKRHVRLSDIEIDNALIEFNSLKPVDSLNKLKYLLGVFEGEIYFFNGRYANQTHQMSLDVDLVEKDNKLNGAYSLKISNQGKVYSHNRGGGDNRQIRFSIKSRCYFLEVSPNEYLCVRKLDDDYGSISGKFYQDNKYIGIGTFFKKI